MASDTNPVEYDPCPKAQGVLLSDVIKTYIDDPKIRLIEEFEPKNLGPASYDLRLGEEYYINGEYKKLSDDNPDLVIPPFSVVVISTHERLHLPRYIIGRWNLRISLVYRGLLWAGGPQVDPGYGFDKDNKFLHGKLFCPLYNLSTQPVILKLRDHVVTIDFVKTTVFDPNNKDCIRFDPKRKGERISELLTTRLESGPADTLKQVEKLSEKVEYMSKEIRENERSISRTFGVVIGVLGVVVAVLAALFGIFNIPGFP